MATGADFKELRSLEILANEMGFVVDSSSYGDDSLSLRPMGDNMDGKLPIYARGTTLFSGNSSELICFLRGWDKAIDYLKLLSVTTDEKIACKEHDFRKEQLVRMLKQGSN